ncbi:MAG: Alpha-galactosidase [Thermocaproicibacter melissae]|jgi:alpha-galactosidase|uniref:glycoside hydrolase family 27 protein n=1 Tax=Thermocaproicibacter melissae TaxID=2966552 RepID=UPI003A0FEA8B
MLKRKFSGPPMGWNSYDYYNTNVLESEVKANADYMAEHLKQYGYEYVVVDAGWYMYGGAENRETYHYPPFGHLNMDEFSRLIPCTEKFPSAANGAGFRPLADYVHSKGLKFGIHIMRGIPRAAAHEHRPIRYKGFTAADIADPSSICKWNPDMYGVRATEAGQAYYDSLLELYAQWGVDFIKCDDICNTNMYVDNPYSAEKEIEMLSKAVERCGREIVLSLSPGPAVLEKAWHYEKYANMWRITNDIWDDWKLIKDMFTRCSRWQEHVSEGSYPDCDMLPLGKIGRMFFFFDGERSTRLTPDEQKSMMTLWCIFRSPLMLGAELTKLDSETLKLITNREVLALVGEDHVSRQVALSDDYSVWASHSTKDGSIVLALFNLADSAATVSCDLTEAYHALKLEVPDKTSGKAKELWNQTTVEWKENTVSAELPAHGCTLLRLL